ncbi:DNA polymerase epsilon subunit C [Nilaparvata lugens]|uniref:DNA polymerase epsilon subunit C n=1 Tax=Nilaparvata lugens TaxID=108931 RepID=UPI00193DE636|nr:DNA polymerase epsilon subunit C [Nilaparvata lugens]
MPSKKRKYNARFPAGRIKKIMQTDEEVGKVAQAVPVIISRTLELFVESLLTKTLEITMSKSAKTLSPSHMKQCILSESRFDFLKDLVKSLPDSAPCEDESISGPAKSAGQQSLLHSPSPIPTENDRHYFGAPNSERTAAAAAAATAASRTPVNANFYTDQLQLPLHPPPTSYLVSQSPPRSSPPTLVVDEDYDT